MFINFNFRSTSIASPEAYAIIIRTIRDSGMKYVEYVNFKDATHIERYFYHLEKAITVY